MDQQHQLKKHNSNEGEKESRSAATHFASDTTQLKAAAITPPLSSAVPAQMKPVSYGETQDAEADLLPGDTMQLMASGDEGESPSPPSEESNNNGLPDQLKAGIESLSGISMDDVRVNYNSSKPAAMNARAYAKGSDIHLGAGQEEHLAHEAWHVVQQKQGRVKPTIMKKGNIPVNDNAGLEKEADVMGAKAANMSSSVADDKILQKKSSNSAIHQLVGERLTVLAGAEESTSAIAAPDRTGIVIEVMIQNNGAGLENAKNKIEQLAEQKKSSLNVCIAIGLNAQEGGKDVKNLVSDCAMLKEHAETLKVKCAIIPMTWHKHKDVDKGYVFPYLEARAQLGQHTKTKSLRAWAGGSAKVEKVKEGDEEAPLLKVFHRTMDADVSDDPLLGDSIKKSGKKKPKETTKDKATRLKKRNDRHKQVSDSLQGDNTLVTGGYNWDTGGLEKEPIKAKLITVVNKFEHEMREVLAKKVPQSLYLPEPNTYIPQGKKDDWDAGLISDMNNPRTAKVQMGESTFGRKGAGNSLPISHKSEISTTKPRKAWLNNFEPLIGALERENMPSIEAEFNKLVVDIHQSVLKSHTLEKTARAHGKPLKEKVRAQIDPWLADQKKVLLKKILSEVGIEEKEGAQVEEEEKKETE